MAKLTDKQRASLDRSADRANARRGDGVLSLFIRVAESRIYEGKPILKALLKEVIYLRMTDLVEDDPRIPNNTPWKASLYEGWCWASQKYLARRVGMARENANRGLKRVAEDGYLKVRKHRGRRGAWHMQYWPDEAFIDARIKELDEATCHIVTRVGDESSLGHVSYRHKAMCSIVTRPRDESSQQVVSEGVFEGVLEGCVSSTPPSGEEKQETLRSHSQNRNGSAPNNNHAIAARVV